MWSPYISLYLHAALLTGIKEISEKQQKEDDALLSIAAGNRRPVVPDLKFEFPDSDVHKDVYELIKYACGEICTTDQFDEVMKVWTTFLEPMLGVPPHPECVEEIEDSSRANNHVTKNLVLDIGESDGSPAKVTAISNCKQSNPSRIGGENTPPENSSSSPVWLGSNDNGVKEDNSHDQDHDVHKSDMLGRTCKPGKEHTTELSNETSRTATQVAYSSVLVTAEVEKNEVRANGEFTSGYLRLV